MSVWTHGRWIVKPGSEKEFVAAARELALALHEELGSPLPTFLRDRDRPNVFLTFGRWENLEAIERFRMAAMPRITEMHPLLDHFEAFTLDEVGIPVS